MKYFNYSGTNGMLTGITDECRGDRSMIIPKLLKVVGQTEKKMPNYSKAQIALRLLQAGTKKKSPLMKIRIQIIEYYLTEAEKDY